MENEKTGKIVDKNLRYVHNVHYFKVHRKYGAFYDKVDINNIRFMGEKMSTFP